MSSHRRGPSSGRASLPWRPLGVPAAVVATLVCAGAARSCPPDAAVRIAAIQHALDDEAPRSRTWALGWGLGYGALAVGQLAVMPAFPKSEWPDYYLGAAGSAIGVLAIALAPPSEIRAAPRLDARVAAMTRADECAVLADAERSLAVAARHQRIGTGVVAQVGNAVINIALGVTLAGAFHRLPSAALSVGAGLMIGEVQILTQPTDLIDADERYRRGDLSRPRPPSLRMSLAPMPLPGGVGVWFTTIE